MMVLPLHTLLAITYKSNRWEHLLHSNRSSTISITTKRRRLSYCIAQMAQTMLISITIINIAGRHTKLIWPCLITTHKLKPITGTIITIIMIDLLWEYGCMIERHCGFWIYLGQLIPTGILTLSSMNSIRVWIIVGWGWINTHLYNNKHHLWMWITITMSSCFGGAARKVYIK